MEDQALSRASALTTGLAASVGAVLSVAWWLDPSIADATGEAVMAFGFLLVFAGVVLALVLAYARGPGFARTGLSAPWTITPVRLRNWLVLVVTVAVLSAVVAAVEGRGYSQNSPGQLAGCNWSIVTDQGKTNICVNHSRWLATGQQVERIFVGFFVIMLAFECAAFTTISRTPVRRTGTRPRSDP